MEQVAIAVVEEDQAVAHGCERLTDEMDALGFQLLVGGVEIVTGYSKMTDASVFVVGDRLRRGQRPLGGYDFEHGAVGRFDEIVSGVSEIDVEAQVFDVPFGEFLGIGRRDRRMLETLEHKERL